MKPGKYKIKFLLEKRKDKLTGELIVNDIPIIMDVTFDSKRMRYYSGYRIDEKNWNEDSQKVKKNVVNKIGINASIINKRLDKLKPIIDSIFTQAHDQAPEVDQLRRALKKELGEDVKEMKEKTLFDLFEQYLGEADISEKRRKQMRSTMNHFSRFAISKGYKLTFKQCDKHTLSEFEKYLKNDKDKPKSGNTRSAILKKLKSFFSYAKKEDWTDNNPFSKFKIPSEKYGKPIYLTKQERDMLYHADIKNEKFDRVRDLFVLQCHLGCRIGDFVKLKKSNIVNDFVNYIPAKTAKEKPDKVKVPLTKTAKAIIEKYDLPNGNLAPYISDQRFNEYLKELFEEVKLNRKVPIFNPTDNSTDMVPLHKIASSHMARRTFIGILHRTQKNEVIASMTGHSADSRSFKRYYDVDYELIIDAMKDAE